MKKIILVLAVLSLVGLGCQKNSSEITTEKIQQALSATAKNLNWSDAIISKEPSEENFYSNSYLLYGPSRELGLENIIDNIEAMEFVTFEAAQKIYKSDECFKGNGKPIIISGISGCCLNDIKKGASTAIMAKDEFIFKSITYFNAECGAVEYLKNFWKNL